MKKLNLFVMLVLISPPWQSVIAWEYTTTPLSAELGATAYPAPWGGINDDGDLAYMGVLRLNTGAYVNVANLTGYYQPRGISERNPITGGLRTVFSGGDSNAPHGIVDETGTIRLFQTFTQGVPYGIAKNGFTFGQYPHAPNTNPHDAHQQAVIWDANGMGRDVHGAISSQLLGGLPPQLFQSKIYEIISESAWPSSRVFATGFVIVSASAGFQNSNFLFLYDYQTGVASQIQLLDPGSVPPGLAFSNIGGGVSVQIEQVIEGMAFAPNGDLWGTMNLCHACGQGAGSMPDDSRIVLKNLSRGTEFNLSQFEDYTIYGGGMGNSSLSISGNAVTVYSTANGGDFKYDQPSKIIRWIGQLNAAGTNFQETETPKALEYLAWFGPSYAPSGRFDGVIADQFYPYGPNSVNSQGCFVAAAQMGRSTSAAIVKLCRLDTP